MGAQTLQPDATDGKDCRVSSGTPTTTTGTSTTAPIAGDAGGSGTQRMLIEFDLDDFGIVSGDTINSFTLTLDHASTIAAGTFIDLHRVTEAWNEAEACWNDRTTGVPWTNAGGTFDPVAAGSYEGTGVAAAPVVLAIAALAQDALDNRAGILSCIVKLRNESGVGVVASLRTSDNGTAADRPEAAAIWTTPEEAANGAASPSNPQVKLLFNMLGVRL
jgi:hypothetical protein